MSDLVHRISDHDDAEMARKRNVAAKNPVIFDTLFKALGDRVSIYNERHPQGFGLPNAFFMSGGPIYKDSNPSTSTESSLKIQKKIEPTSSLTLSFPINSGAMQLEFSAETDTLKDSIKPDVVSDTPTYDFGGKNYRAETLADLLFVRLLSPTEPLAAGRKIGFV